MDMRFRLRKRLRKPGNQRRVTVLLSCEWLIPPSGRGIYIGKKVHGIGSHYSKAPTLTNLAKLSHPA
ncbi:hypothetical protein V6N13_079112 [Hibiscus sabdariffa]